VIETKHLDALYLERPAWLAYGLAVMIAGAYVAWLYPTAFLTGSSGMFERGDPALSSGAFMSYAADDWHFPWLWTHSINAPEGVSIAFTDSIPLAAVPAKLVYRWLPAGSHYFGWWHLIAYVSQALGAVFLARALGYKGLLAAASMAGFAILAPIFAARIGHTALLTQGILLFALGLYSLGVSRRRPFRVAASSFVLLLLASLLIQVYLFAMAGAVFLAFLWDAGIRTGHWRHALLALAAAGVLILLFAALFGFYGLAVNAGGFAHYSMSACSLDSARDRG